MPESPMGNFIADAMREATGADIAICNHRHERGIPLKPGDLTLTDLVNYHRPFNRVLVTFEATGQELIDIIEANLAEEQRREWLVQISGARYEFTDKTVVDTDIARSRTYTVVTEDNVPQRESMKLAGRFGKIDYERTNIAITAALWAHVQRNPEMRAVRDGRVKER